MQHHNTRHWNHVFGVGNRVTTVGNHDFTFGNRDSGVLYLDSTVGNRDFPLGYRVPRVENHAFYIENLDFAVKYRDFGRQNAVIAAIERALSTQYHEFEPIFSSTRVNDAQPGLLAPARPTYCVP